MLYKYLCKYFIFTFFCKLSVVAVQIGKFFYAQSFVRLKINTESCLLGKRI